MSDMKDENLDSGTLLTVALCTHNHRARLARTLGDLTQLVPPDCQWDVLIVDNASTDGTSELLRASGWRKPGMNFRVVREEKLGVSHARNRALQDATGRYVVFMDDDETPDPHWLVEYVRTIRSERPDALGGRIEVMFEDCGRPAWLQDELMGFLGQLNHGGAARKLVAADTPLFAGNFAFRRRIFARIGHFDSGLGRKGGTNTGGEDVEMYRRMLASECNVWWVPDAVVYHRIQASKLRRSYFLDLHFRQGHTEGMRRRGDRRRMPPAYLIPQLVRALRSALSERLRRGPDASLRKEMNVAYFLGYIWGWASRHHA